MLAKLNGVFRLSRDVELRYLPSGAALAKLSLVNSSKYKTQSGEQKEESCFIDATVFGKLAEVANNYLHKGSKLYVVGELKQETWQTQDGQNRSKHSIKIDSFEMLDSKPQGGQQPQQQPAQQQYTQPVQNNIPEIEADEIPF